MSLPDGAFKYWWDSSEYTFLMPQWLWVPGSGYSVSLGPEVEHVVEQRSQATQDEYVEWTKILFSDSEVFGVSVTITLLIHSDQHSKWLIISEVSVAKMLQEKKKYIYICGATIWLIHSPGLASQAVETSGTFLSCPHSWTECDSVSSTCT